MSCRSSHRPDRMHPTANTPPLCGRIFPYPLLSASQPPANTLLYTVSTNLCSPLLRAAATCAIPLRIRKVPIRKNRTGRPDAHTVGRTLRSQKPAAFHIHPSKTEAQRSEGRPTDTKKAPAHCAGAVSDAPRKAERRRENYFAIPFMIAPETPGAAWYSPNE